MDKFWFIEIKGTREGPFSVEELKKDRRLTPDTFVWKKGFVTWKRIRDVQELKFLFNDDIEETPQDEEKVAAPDLKKESDELIVLEMPQPPYLFWILAALIILLYFIIQTYWLQLQ